VRKTEDQVKKEREDLWQQVEEDNRRSGVNIDEILVKQNGESLFGLEISQRQSFEK
jgi:hypothetical protein